MITRDVDYALRVLTHMTAHPEADGIATSELAPLLEVPYRYLRKLIPRMVAAGFLQSRRGRGGGLRMTASPTKVSLLDIIHALAPEAVTLNRCLLRKKTCTRTKRCTVHRTLGDLQRRINTALDGTTLQAMSGCVLRGR